MVEMTASLRADWMVGCLEMNQVALLVYSKVGSLVINLDDLLEMKLAAMRVVHLEIQ
jgi:hypothetical protein